MVNSKKLSGIAYAVSAAVLFGIIPIFSKTVLCSGVNSLSLVLIRYTLAVFFTAAIMLVKKASFRVTKRQFLSLLVFGTIGGGLTSYLLTTSYEYLPVGISTMLHFSYLLFVMLIVILFFREKCTFAKIIALVLAVGGIILMTDFTGTMKPIGTLLAVSSGLGLAIYIVAMSKSSFKALSPFTVFFYVSLFSSVFLSIAVLIKGDFTLPPTGTQWTYMLIIGFLTSVSHSMLTAGVQKLSASTASIINMLEPLTSIAAGALFLQEFPSFRAGVGCVLVLAGIVITVVKKE